MTIALWQRPLTQVVNSIVKAGNGCWLDPSDMSTMYQDAAGTIPVTAVEQPVGKILDKSGNGNHATQSITASRPVLSARYNLLTKTEDFAAGSVWSSNQMFTYSNISVNPFGNELTADKLVPSTSNNPHFIYFNIFPFVSGTSYTFSVYCAAAGLRYIQLTLPSGAFGISQYANFDLQTGTITQVIDCTASIEACPNGFYRISITKTCLTTSSGGGAIAPIPDQSSGRLGAYLGDGVSGCYVWGADLKIGTTTCPYQRVNTATDYDTDPRYFPKYLRFDGVDDYLNLPYMGLYANGSASVIAALSNLNNQTNESLVCEANNASISQIYLPMTNISGSTYGAYIRNDKNAVLLNYLPVESYISPALIKAHVDTGSEFKMHRNSIGMTAVSYVRGGTLSPNIATIGCAKQTSTFNFFGGRLYGLILTKSALTDAQRIKCERFLARKAGVML